jgi:hypothetical protein
MRFRKETIEGKEDSINLKRKEQVAVYGLKRLTDYTRSRTNHKELQKKCTFNFIFKIILKQSKKKI